MKQGRSAAGDRKLMMEALEHCPTSATLLSLVTHHPFWTDPLSLDLTFGVKNCYSDCSENPGRSGIFPSSTAHCMYSLPQYQLFSSVSLRRAEGFEE
jgi:hypothetical protein